LLLRNRWPPPRGRVKAGNLLLLMWLEEVATSGGPLAERGAALAFPAPNAGDGCAVTPGNPKAYA
jgi:hypothetical protein